MNGKANSAAAIVRAVLTSELLQLVRDRRALFTAVLLPALLYPLLFLGGEKLEDFSRDQLAAREVTVAVDFTGAHADVAELARARFAELSPIQVVERDAAALLTLSAILDAEERESEEARTREVVEALLGETGHLLVTAAVDPEVATRDDFHLYYDVKGDLAREARERVEDALAEMDRELSAQRLADILGEDPARGLDVELVDVASAEDASGAALGRLLPLLAVLVLLAGGSYAALAVFAGEREAGTLETLLVQPVAANRIAWGKFGAVLVTALVTLGVNFASMLFCLSQGIGSLPDVDAEGGVGLARLFATLVYLPGCVLLCAVLCLVCGRARTFREGQMTIFPVMLAALAPTAIVFLPSVEMDVLLAMIPLAGPALALRDALRGDLALVPVLAMFASHAVWAWLALSQLASILDAEKVFKTAGTESERVQRHELSRHAVYWGFAIVLVNYLLGSRLTGWNFAWGTALTFWVMLPILIALYAHGAAKRTGEPWLSQLGLGRPALHHVVGALLLAPGLAWLAGEFIPWQQKILPLPEGALEGSAMAEAIMQLATWKLLFLLAFSPGVIEELLFRGALLTGMKRDLKPAQIVLWQAVLFAAVHASIYRLIPTFTLGALFTVFALRARSVVPVMVLHVAYNALTVLSAAERLPAWYAEWGNWLPWAALPGALLLALPPGPPKDT